MLKKKSKTYIILEFILSQGEVSGKIAIVQSDKLSTTWYAAYLGGFMF